VIFPWKTDVCRTLADTTRNCANPVAISSARYRVSVIRSCGPLSLMRISNRRVGLPAYGLPCFPAGWLLRLRVGTQMEYETGGHR
jgi:hypothetical protein